MPLTQLGIIVNSRGLTGELILANAFKNIYLPAGVSVLIGYNSSFVKEYTLSKDFATGNKSSQSIASPRRSDALFLENVCSKEDAEKLKENGVFIDKDLVLTHNKNYIFKEDIINCNVLDEKHNRNVGIIVDVWEMPANDVWIVQNDAGKLPIPAVASVIKDCDFVNKIIKINMLNGLEELMFK